MCRADGGSRLGVRTVSATEFCRERAFRKTDLLSFSIEFQYRTVDFKYNDIDGYSPKNGIQASTCYGPCTVQYDTTKYCTTVQ